MGWILGPQTGRLALPQAMYPHSPASRGAPTDHESGQMRMSGDGQYPLEPLPPVKSARWGTVQSISRGPRNAIVRGIGSGCVRSRAHQAAATHAVSS